MRFSKSETTTQKEEEEISRHYLKSNYWIDWTKALNMITEEWMKLQKCTYKRSDWRRSKHVDEKTPPYLSPQKIDDRKTKQFPIFNIIQEKESKKATTTTLLLFRLSFIYKQDFFSLFGIAETNCSGLSRTFEQFEDENPGEKLPYIYKKNVHSKLFCSEEL